jgi:DNA-binding GntR family transcriptional regulator
MYSLKTKCKGEEMSKSDVAYEFLKNEIILFHYRPGEKVNIRDIARKLGVSDIPVREALKRLESEGLIEFENNRGARIAPFDAKSFIDICNIRFELEVFATRLATEKITDEEIEILEEYVDKMDECIEQNNLDMFGKYNSKFHHTLYKCARSPVLIETLENLTARSHYSKSIFALVPSRLKDSNKEHKEIVEALKSRDPERAAQIIRHQKEFSTNRLLDALETVTRFNFINNN